MSQTKKKNWRDMIGDIERAMIGVRTAAQTLGNTPSGFPDVWETRAAEVKKCQTEFYAAVDRLKTHLIRSKR